MNKLEFEEWVDRDINRILLNAQWRFDFKGERYVGGLSGLEAYCKNCHEKLRPLAMRIYGKLINLTLSCRSIGFIYTGFMEELEEQFSQEGLLSSESSCRELSQVPRVTY